MATRSPNHSTRLVLTCLIVALPLSGCGSYGSSSGPNPNMVALNARYGMDPSDKRAEQVPLFLYYPDAPRPQSPPTPVPSQTHALIVAEQMHTAQRSARNGTARATRS